MRMPTSTFNIEDPYIYLEGLGSYHQSQAIDGALPKASSCPQKPPYGLYIERISATAFTAPRSQNRQTWLYRILPSVSHSRFQSYTNEARLQSHEISHTPDNFTWSNFGLRKSVDWVNSLNLLAQAGDPSMKTGLAYHIFFVDKSMPARQAFSSSDGEFLIVLQKGVLDIQTELGNLLVRANEIAVIPRGMQYRVDIPNGPARGYVLELYQGHFQVPELGPIGSCSLANVRDFLIPTARFRSDLESEWQIVTKYNGRLFASTQDHTVFDVVAWHGTCYPYKYDLGRFNTLGSVSYDHPDPSLYTVLTAPSDHPGTSIADFVAFPPRWEVSEDTYRAPYYHCNTMSEFVGIICPGDDGQDDQDDRDFYPFGGELINCMVPHGPDKQFHEFSTNAELRPLKISNGQIRFMFETCYMMGLTDWALKTSCPNEPAPGKHGGFIPASVGEGMVTHGLQI